MSIGDSIATKAIFRMINEDRKTQLEEYYKDTLIREYEQFHAREEFLYFMQNIGNDLSTLDSDLLREYSGFNYKHINNALRRRWNYEENGHMDGEEKFVKKGEKLSEIISEHPTTFGNFKAFRGVSIEYFQEYGITKIEELKNMEGKFLYDSGLVSTSLLEETCFFNMENDIGMNYNVEIIYLIPEEFQDGIYLNYGDTYSINQNEYLINRGNLAKISSVKINSDGTAQMVVTMIPKKIYDEYYDNLERNKAK